MALTEIAIKNAKPRDKNYKLSDVLGLYLLIRPSGSKMWRYDYVFRGKRKTFALGRYPEVTLHNARRERDRIKSMILEGIDPAQHKRLVRIEEGIARANTFGAIADEYLKRLEEKDPPFAEITMSKKRWILVDLVGNDFRDRPISEITAAEVLDVLKRLEKSGRRETARRSRSTISSVFRYAITTLRANTDPTHVLDGAILPPKVTHMAAITDEQEFGRLLSVIDEYDGWVTIRLALLFTALTFARPGEVRLATWSEIDMKNKVWNIPAERTKMRRAHDVPLSRQALLILKEARAFDPYSELVFPSIRTNKKSLSENAMNSALRRMGYKKDEATAHGFRSSASSILNGRRFDADVIEAQLSHLDTNKVRRIYNRSDLWDERVELMRKWVLIATEN